MSTVEVQAAVEKYVSGVIANDVGLVSSAFRVDAVMWGFLGGDSVVTLPISTFLDVVAGAPDPSGWAADYTHKIHSIEITGDVAVAVLEETGYLGGADFTNYFSLVREDGRWQIAGKTFFLTAGALPRPS